MPKEVSPKEQHGEFVRAAREAACDENESPLRRSWGRSPSTSPGRPERQLPKTTKPRSDPGLSDSSPRMTMGA